MTYTPLLAGLGAAVCIVAPLQAQSVSTDPRLKSDLETVYNTWRQSMVRENFESWKKCTASYRQVKVRNLAVSEKRAWPKTLFNQPFSPPSLTNLRYIGAIVKGPTAAATYYGKVDWGIGGTPTENAYVVLFANERGVWKYDQARFFNLSHLPKVRERLSRGDASVLQEQDGFHPLGSIPAVPKLCPAPKYIAKVFVDCPGRIVNATVNNVSQHSFEDTRMAEVISGGVHDGVNLVTLNVQPAPGGKPGPFSFAIFIMPEVVGNVPGVAYTYQASADQPIPSGPITFNVTPEVLQRMTPPKGQGGQGSSQK
jgi:hypothetical protein